MRLHTLALLVVMPVLGQYTPAPKAAAELLADLQRKALSGEVAAQTDLGYAYANGHLGLIKDVSKAAKWFRKAAEQGHAEAQVLLAACYVKGEGVPEDFPEAVKWYRLSALQGNARAQFSLAELYKYGVGVTQDHIEAARWYRKAAEQGVIEAQLYLGISYYLGDKGVPQDYAEAYVWLSLATAGGDKQAPEIRGRAAQRLTSFGLEQAKARARKLHEDIQARKEKK